MEDDDANNSNNPMSAESFVIGTASQDWDDSVILKAFNKAIKTHKLGRGGAGSAAKAPAASSASGGVKRVISSDAAYQSYLAQISERAKQLAAQAGAAAASSSSSAAADAGMDDEADAMAAREAA